MGKGFSLQIYNDFLKKQKISKKKVGKGNKKSTLDKNIERAILGLFLVLLAT